MWDALHFQSTTLKYSLHVHYIATWTHRVFLADFDIFVTLYLKMSPEKLRFTITASYNPNITLYKCNVANEIL